MEAMGAIISSERHLDRIATTLENLEKFFIATSVEEVQKRVEDMKSGRA
jgi:tRNA A58 N-methylase Trm61